MSFFLRPQSFFDLGDSAHVLLFALAKPINFAGELGLFAVQFFDSGGCQFESFLMLRDTRSLLRFSFAKRAQLLVQFLFPFGQFCNFGFSLLSNFKLRGQARTLLFDAGDAQLRGRLQRFNLTA